ncbi:MAG: arginine deiminase-related protein [Gemmatimonadales bacterium]
MPQRAASHVLMIEPVGFGFNPETAESNAFQHDLAAAEVARLGRLALEQHRAFRAALVASGVCITVTRSRADTPDAAFCNNWFSTHRPADPELPRTLVTYPMLAANRRTERRRDLIEMLRVAYPRTLDLSSYERSGLFLEGTGSLCLDDDAMVAYAALSPRTERSLAEQWAGQLEYRLIAFTATDAAGVPYYHTNVMMFLGHHLAIVCLESIPDPAERVAVNGSLRDSGYEVLEISREQVLHFCGNGLALLNDRGDPLFAMSSAAYHGFTAEQRQALERRATVVHTDLSAFETLGGGSARCLLGELI